MGYAPGETIRINGEINNSSGQRIKRSQAVLTQVHARHRSRRVVPRLRQVVDTGQSSLHFRTSAGKSINQKVQYSQVEVVL